MQEPQTLSEAIRYYSNEQTCIDLLASLRWPDGQVVCTACGEIGNTIWLANQKRWKCRGCKKQFSVKVGTIMEDSPISLDKWMVAFWMLANCRNGVSSYEIKRAIGVTQKSTWHMLHRIRLAMTDLATEKFGTDFPIEIDETFVGGKVRNMHKSRRDKRLNYSAGNGKAIVMGMLERGGRVRARVIADRKVQTMRPVLEGSIERGANVITDEHVSYPFLAKENEYAHEIINHIEGYVRGHIHTNGIENFWSCLKRSLGGTYISVEPFHLERYVDEQVFRFNLRKQENTDASRFKAALKDIVGRRLTYAELTGRLNPAA
ncbi:IS1595 family transposase [Telmatobacter sp. DSM 110680]|uniref:IS1595 family transposase n=1 Tax=Telmatobacter sp. DSM 110680 TaxID=3036704 RepID=A0AAU7DRB9_9BACT